MGYPAVVLRRATVQLVIVVKACALMSTKVFTRVSAKTMDVKSTLLVLLLQIHVKPQLMMCMPVRRLIRQLVQVMTLTIVCQMLVSVLYSIAIAPHSCVP